MAKKSTVVQGIRSSCTERKKDRHKEIDRGDENFDKEKPTASSPRDLCFHSNCYELVGRE